MQYPNADVLSVTIGQVPIYPNLSIQNPVLRSWNLVDLADSTVSLPLQDTSNLVLQQLSQKLDDNGSKCITCALAM